MNARDIYTNKWITAFTLSFLWFLILIVPVSARTSDRDDPYRIEEFTLNSPGNLEVKTSGGHITVQASESNRVRVEMYVTRNGRELSPSDTDLSDFDIKISQSGNKVAAIAQRKNNRRWKFWNNDHIAISFVVYTPQEVSSDLKTSGGHIEVSGLNGNQEISTSGGHLNLSGIRGIMDARTSGGHIEVRDFEGEMSARTSGGHIDVEQAEGSINVRTSGGHINLENVSGTVEASTSGGSITADLNEVGQFVNLRTSGGNVNISVPGNTGFDLNLKGSYVSASLENFSGEVERDEVEGQLNGGGPQISARTSGGTVSVSFN